MKKSTFLPKIGKFTRYFDYFSLEIEQNRTYFCSRNIAKWCVK